MSKLIGLLLILAMAVHIIMPLGLPGLRRRGDFWKIAIVAFAIWSIALVFREVFSSVAGYRRQGHRDATIKKARLQLQSGFSWRLLKSALIRRPFRVPSSSFP